MRSDDLEARYRAIASAEDAAWDDLIEGGVRSFADAWERAADRAPDRVVAEEIPVAPEGARGERAATYGELDRLADRVAAWALARGEDRYGVRQGNGIAFLAALIGLAKAGRLAVLLGTQVPRGASAALAAECGVRTVIGEPLPGLALAPVDELLDAAWPGRLAAGVRDRVGLDDPVVVIFTSGTTGRSKAALFSHRRLIGAGIAWGLRAGLAADDRSYIALPLSHGNALAVAFSSVVHTGGTALLRPKFSASRFLPEVRAHHATAVVYVGELWRYLAAIPASPDDADNPVRVVFGNGLCRALWEPTVRRFGIAHVVEHYGATELPAGALTNWTDTPGFCGYVPPGHPDAEGILLVDEEGREVAPGQPGELLLRVRGTYRGYLDPTHDEARLLRGVARPGDVYWRSGDLLVRDADGFFTFVDRLGDTYRWRGENVAAADVEAALYDTGAVDEAVVVGVRLPGEEGKVGMASILPRDDRPIADLEPLREALARRLPPYALPIFVRQVRERHGATATLKIQKAALAGAPFALVGACPHAVLRGGRYEPLDRPRLDLLLRGERALRPGVGFVDPLEEVA